MGTVSLDTGHNDGRSGGPSSPMEMHPPKKRRPLPSGPLMCPWCASPDVDEDARRCRQCETVIPIGGALRQQPQRAASKGMRASLASMTQTQHQGIDTPSWSRGR